MVRRCDFKGGARGATRPTIYEMSSSGLGLAQGRPLFHTRLRQNTALFLTLLFAYVYAHQAKFGTLIPASRLDLLHSLIVQGTFNIDSYHQNTPDKAFFGGHYFCDKAPGVVLVALPAFGLATKLLALFHIDVDSDAGWLISSWMACAGSLAVITALGGVATFRWLSRRVAPRTALATTFAFYLGTLCWPYSTFMMSNGIVVPLLCLSLWAFDFNSITSNGHRETNLPWPRLRYGLGGAACGLALACEYTAGLSCLALTLYFWLRERKVFAFALGVSVPLLSIPLYHWACFGTPFTLAYSHEAVFTEMHEGLFGIHFPPSATVAFKLLFGTQQGLFFWSPFLVLAIFGFRPLYSHDRCLFWICYLTPIMHLIAISGYYFPSAGGLFSARLLAPIVPFFVLPAAFACRTFPRTSAGLIGASIVLTGLGATVGAVLPMHMPGPLWQYHLPNLFQGKLCPNIGTALGLTPGLSLLLLAGTLGVSFWYLWRKVPPAANQDFPALNQDPGPAR